MEDGLLRERLRENWRRWKAKNVEKERERLRLLMQAKRAAMTFEERQAENKAAYERVKKKRAQDAAFDAEFRAKAKARHDAWRESKRDHVNEASRLWRESNAELVRSMTVRAMAARRAAGPLDTHTVLWLRSQPCIDCGSTKKIEIGHIVPIKLGGTNDPANLIPQCRSCNRRLSARPHRLAEENPSGKKLR